MLHAPHPLRSLIVVNMAPGCSTPQLPYSTKETARSTLTSDVSARTPQAHGGASCGHRIVRGHSNLRASTCPSALDGRVGCEPVLLPPRSGARLLSYRDQSARRKEPGGRARSEASGTDTGLRAWQSRRRLGWCLGASNADMWHYFDAHRRERYREAIFFSRRSSASLALQVLNRAAPCPKAHLTYTAHISASYILNISTHG